MPAPASGRPLATATLTPELLERRHPEYEPARDDCGRSTDGEGDGEAGGRPPTGQRG